MFDLVIRNALVVDGSGGAPRPGHLGVRGDRIAWVAPAPGPGAQGLGPGAPGPEPGALPAPGVPAQRVIDAAGLALAPGFIDIHTHSDLTPLVDPWMPSALHRPGGARRRGARRPLRRPGRARARALGDPRRVLRDPGGPPAGV